MMVSAARDPRRASSIWALNLDEPRPVLTPLVHATFRRGGSEAAPCLAATLSGLTKAEALSRLEAGRRCYTVWIGEVLAGYGWVSFDEEYLGELNLRVRLVPGEAYIWDCFIQPAFRQNHLYSALLDHIVRELGAGPLCRAWIGANLDNLASQRGIARAGFKAAADLVVERVLAMRMVWVRGRYGVPENIVSEVRRAFLDNRDTVWRSAIL